MDARVFWGLDRLPRLSISLMHQQIPLHLDAGPHFLSGTWFVSISRDIFPEDHYEEGASPGMLLVDVVLRANLFPLQHRVQRRGPF
ncbi:hypothetical protein CK203_006554 [Vitis vinifera]|uniref:Uncharacterized protein n=1 Tax=Vitis vinifera TaxID=29760 RepID=A0A438KBI9_VITVI|nr:hypothetical protein CK203_006554 [Vitis vinifera]